jgi:predicted lipid carrier protein YhbT
MPRRVAVMRPGLPVPLFLLQPVLEFVAVQVAKSRPDMFKRLGPHANKRFLIDPREFPFVLLLVPCPERPHLTAHRRGERLHADVQISAAFLTLFGMVDGSSDGDALFFGRDLRITGDVEAVVALRNALDDFDGSLVETIVGGFGVLSRPAAGVASFLRRLGSSADAAKR